MNFSESFVEGLKETRNLYVRCLNCDEIISLHDSPPFYLKTAPDNILTKASQIVANGNAKVKEEREKGKHKLELNDEIWSKKYQSRLDELKAFKSNTFLANKKVNEEHTARALRSQKSQYAGRLGEMLPLIATRYTGINPFEICFIRPQPVDLIAFEGLLKKDVQKITFIDVKTGNAALTPTQKSIQRAIDRNRVEFRTYKVNVDALDKPQLPAVTKEEK